MNWQLDRVMISVDRSRSIPMATERFATGELGRSALHLRLASLESSYKTSGHISCSTLNDDMDGVDALGHDRRGTPAGEQAVIHRVEAAAFPLHQL